MSNKFDCSDEPWRFPDSGCSRDSESLKRSSFALKKQASQRQLSIREQSTRSLLSEQKDSLRHLIKNQYQSFRRRSCHNRDLSVRDLLATKEFGESITSITASMTETSSFDDALFDGPGFDVCSVNIDEQMREWEFLTGIQKSTSSDQGFMDEFKPSSIDLQDQDLDSSQEFDRDCCHRRSTRHSSRWMNAPWRQQHLWLKSSTYLLLQSSESHPQP